MFGSKSMGTYFKPFGTCQMYILCNSSYTSCRWAFLKLKDFEIPAKLEVEYLNELLKLIIRDQLFITSKRGGGGFQKNITGKNLTPLEKSEMKKWPSQRIMFLKFYPPPNKDTHSFYMHLNQYVTLYVW